MALSLKIWQNKQCINNYKNISNSNLRDPSIHNWLKKFPLFSVRSKIQNSKSKIHISSLLGPILIRHFQWYKECLNSMSFEPYNRLLKVQESIGTPTPKVGAHLGVCGFIPSHSPTFLGAWNVTPKLHSWLAPLQAFTLVVSGMRKDFVTTVIKTPMERRLHNTH